MQEELWWRGRIGRLEDKIHTALSAADGLPVTTADLVRWVYFGARSDMHPRRPKEPFPDPYYRPPVTRTPLRDIHLHLADLRGPASSP